MEKLFSQDDLTKILNEWMRRFIEEPDKFMREFEAVNKYLNEKQFQLEPSYGEVCSEYMMQLHKELEANG